MKVVKDQPTSGSFVQVYTYEGNVFAESYRWENDKLLTYIEYHNIDTLWSEVSEADVLSDMSNVHYIYKENLVTDQLAKELAEINEKIEAIAKKHGIEISDL